MVPQLPQVIGRTDPATEREAGGDGSGDIASSRAPWPPERQRQCELAGQRRGKCAASSVGMPVVDPRRAVAEITAVLALQIVDRVALADDRL